MMVWSIREETHFFGTRPKMADPKIMWTKLEKHMKKLKKSSKGLYFNPGYSSKN
jgi:hypothetical protein